MKKILALLLSLTMLASLAACGSNEQPAETPTEPATQPSILPAPGDLTKPAPPYETGTEAPTEAPTGAPTEAPTEAPAEPQMPVDTLSPMVDQIYAIKGPQFMYMTMPVDLADADTTAWLTGVTDSSLLTEAVVNESMMGAQAYSLVLARVKDAAKAEEVAQMMLDNIDPRKWICVEADDIAAAIKGDLVMFIMIDSQMGLPAADMVDAFSQVAGGVDKTLSK